MLLDRKMEYNGQKILVSNKKYTNINQFSNEEICFRKKIMKF